MSVFNSFCPVPFDQQPLNEFYEMKKSCFFSFFGFKSYQYISRLFIITFVIGFILIPLIFYKIKLGWYIFLTNELFCIICVLILMLLRLYLGWSYILYRLFSATVFYEESGWYDGQIWLKTPEVLMQDRLTATYYIVPLLKRIKYTLYLLTIVMIVDLLIYRLIC